MIATSAVKSGKGNGLQSYDMFNPMEMETANVGGTRLDFISGGQGGYLSKVLE